MNSIKEELKQYSDFRCMKGISEAEISTAEQELNVKFAKDYKEYLSLCGVALCNGHELLGLGSSERLSVVSETKAEKQIYPEISANWYAIEVSGIDDVIIWQADDGKVYQTEGKNTPVPIAESLIEYIKK